MHCQQDPQNLGGGVGLQIILGPFLRIPHAKIEYQPKFQLERTHFDQNFLGLKISQN